MNSGLAEVDVHLVPIHRCSTRTDLFNSTDRGDLKTLPGPYKVDANSLTKPIATHQFQVELIGNSLGLAIITETHLKARHLPSAYQMDDFGIFRRDRLDRHTGGVAVVVRCDLPAAEYVFADDLHDLEMLWVRVCCPFSTIYLGALYHPHHHSTKHQHYLADWNKLSTI